MIDGVLVGIVLFWIAAVALFYTYIGYPLILFGLSRFTRPPTSRSLDELPSVALIIAAYNEEEVIAEKLENSLQLDYPDEKLDIVVFSDASSDRTDEIVRSYADHGIQLRRIEGRVGKTECQNRVAATVDSDFLVFSDANSMYEPDAIRRLLSKFAPGVGCVVGELRYGDDGIEGESMYWRYEQLIKRLESRVYSLVGGNGSIYAVRRSSYVPLAGDSISDFAEPLAIVERGEIVKYAPDAVAWEQTGASVEAELSRRIRIATRSWHTLYSYRSLLNPLQYPYFSLQLVSHKVTRWLSPILFVALFGTNAAVLLMGETGVYVVSILLQGALYATAAVGFVGTHTDLETPSVTETVYYFMVANYGMFVGLVNFVRRRNVVTWETADRRARGE